MILAITTTASAATVITFVAVRSGETFTVSNPHASTVVGHIRLVPDAFTPATSPVSFSLPAQGTQAFPNVLSGFGSVSSPAILAVEGSDTLSVSNVPLRLAFPDRPLTLPVVFNPGAPATGSLVLGILNGLVRVNIYEHATSVTPLVSRTYSAAGEQVMRFRYVDLLPAGVAISDGYATVTPLSGQAVAMADNPPTRHRAAGRAAPPPPVLSITGGAACEFATGIHASVPPTTGASYRWTLVNATAQGALTGSALDLALGSHGYASFMLETTVNGSVATVEATIPIAGKPVYTSSNATSVTLGQDASINWTLADTPTSQSLSGTDFSAVNLAVSDTSYAYRPTTAGSKSYTLNAANPCGSGAATGTYVVNSTCSSTPSAPTISAGGPTTFCSGGSVVLTASAGFSSYLWSNGATTRAVTVSTSGAVTVQGTDASGCQSLASSPTTITVNAVPVINSFVPTPNAIVFGGNSTSLAFNVANASSWSLTSSLGNSISPSSGTGSGALSATFYADNAAGPDKVTLTVTNACGSVSQTICLYVEMSIVYVSPVCGAGSTGNVAGTTGITGASYAWTISGGTITSGAGTSSITYTAGSSPTVQLGLTVMSPNGCAPVSDAKVVTINPAPPVPTITASGPTTFCRPGGSVTLTSSPASTYYWPATNERTQSIVVAQSGSYAVTATNAAGCAATSAPVVVTGNLPPQPQITAPAVLCPNRTGNTASVADAGSGGSYLWSVTNGTLTSGQATRSITFTAGASGSTTLNVTVTTGAGCASSSQRMLGINGALPTAEIDGAAENVCPNGTGYIAGLHTFTDLNGDTITWTVTNGTITGGQGTTDLTYTAGASGTVGLALAVTNACGNTANGSRTVNINGVANIWADAYGACASTERGAGTYDGSSGATYVWTITNGTITSGQGSSQIRYTAGASGTVQLGVQITNASGCTSNGSRSVPINPSPNVTSFTTGTNPVPLSGNATLSFAYANGTSWTIVSSLGNALTPSAGSSTTGGTANYARNTAAGPDTLTLTVTGPCGPVATRTLIIN